MIHAITIFPAMFQRTADIIRWMVAELRDEGEYYALPDVAETTAQYFYKSVPTTPSSWARDDRSALSLWERSAALAGMKK